ncbi:MAG: motility protein A [Anaerolineales bacterium]|nr:motility protein A [Anaerolineales bacterium]
MDLATIIGLVGGIALVFIVLIVEGGSPMELFAAPQAILLTIGGALLATVISYPMKSLGLIPKWLMLAIMGSKEKESPAETINLLSQLADKARREGLLALEEESKKIPNEFLKKGVMMVVDGVDPSQVRAIMEIDIRHMEERHGQGINFFAAAGGYGPTMGIIGTVMGLISVLQKLDDPSTLGHSISAAFLATLWGIFSANIIWLPIAGKLRYNSDEEVAFRRLMLEGILSLQAGENPRIVKEKLFAFLPPKMRQEEGKEGGGKGAPAKAKAKAEA